MDFLRPSVSLFLVMPLGQGTIARRGARIEQSLKNEKGEARNSARTKSFLPVKYLTKQRTP